MSCSVMIDAGHGGTEPGAVYKGRKEKEDTLKLALAVGEILKDSGCQVHYTRETDVYQTPFQKAQIANQSDADLFLSLHRNSSMIPNQYSGVEALVYDDSSTAKVIAENICKQLEKLGFRNIGVSERPNLIVLNRTKMPAVLVEAGFINDDSDNERFDEFFQQIAEAIANGILETLLTDEQ